MRLKTGIETIIGGLIKPPNKERKRYIMTHVENFVSREFRTRNGLIPTNVSDNRYHYMGTFTCVFPASGRYSALVKYIALNAIDCLIEYDFPCYDVEEIITSDHFWRDEQFVEQFGKVDYDTIISAVQDAEKIIIDFIKNEM